MSDRSEDGYRCCDIFPQVLVVFYRIGEAEVERYAFSRSDSVGQVGEVIAGPQIPAIITHRIDLHGVAVFVCDGEILNIPIVVKPKRIGINYQVTVAWGKPSSNMNIRATSLAQGTTAIDVDISVVFRKIDQGNVYIKRLVRRDYVWKTVRRHQLKIVSAVFIKLIDCDAIQGIGVS